MPNDAKLSQDELEARGECLEIIQTLLQGLETGALSINAVRLLLMVLRVHLLALGFERIEHVEVILPATRQYHSQFSPDP